MDALRNDLMYAMRRLVRSPGFSTIAILTVALGIGASTAVFTVVDSVLLRPLRFPEPERLVMVQPSSGSRVSSAYFHDWRAGSRTFDDMIAWRDARANLTGGPQPREVLVDRVTSNFFAVLRMPALLGRTFTTVIDLSRVQPEVVLSHALWQDRYGADARVIGQPITLDGEIYTVVGVMPPGFAIRTTELAESRADLWIPLPLVPTDWTGMGGALNVVGRLRRDATIDQAQADLALIARRIEEQYPSYSRDWIANVVPLLDATVKDVRATLLVLFGAVGILLLMACVNVANLVLCRVAMRQPELAVRLSLGATGGHLVRQLLTESLVLTLVGGACGVLLAIWGTQLLVSALPAGLQLPRTGEISVDLRILGFAIGATIGTGVVFGALPAISSARSASHSAILQRARASTVARHRNRLGSSLIVGEVALTLVLLAGAGLLGRSFWALTRVDPGFEPERVLTVRMTLPASRYDTDDRIRVFSRSLLERVANVRGVSHVGFANYLPLSNFGVAERFEIDGRPEARIEDQKFSWVGVVGGRYFDAMGIPLLRGRLPGDADTEKTQPVFVIDDQLARLYWPNADPIGARLTWFNGDTRLSGEVVGVVGNVRWQAVAAAPPTSAYWWFPQVPGRELTIVARTEGDPTAVARFISAQVTEIDPNQPVGEIRPMTDFVADDLARPRFTTLLLGGFASAAVLLAAVGLYGVLAFAVAQRTREIGVRVALGAQRRDVYRLVMRRGGLLLGMGLALGIAATLALGRLVAGLLYGVTPRDPVTMVTVALFLTAVAIIATYLPARRAMHVDPLVALRAE
jgi:putative ABC transport system permease protein